MEKQLPKDILKKVRQVEIRTSRLVNDSMAGNYHSVFKGSGMNFDEVREYVAGDEIRTIDWNVTARTGIAHVKKFTEERELTIILLIDISASGDFGSKTASKREMMAELGSVLAFSAVRNNDKVGLVLFTDFVELYIPPKKGRSHILRVIREILFFEPQGNKTDLAVPLDFIGRICKRKSVVFLISDFCLPGNYDRLLAELQPKLRTGNRRHDLITMIVSDPREHEIPDVGWLTIEDAESGQQVDLNTSDPGIRQGYARLARSRHQSVLKTIRSAGIDLLELSTDQPYIPSLLGFFGTRKRRLGR